jgi:PAS domain S-box-containing protein
VDDWKTKAELIEELNTLRARVASLSAEKTPADATPFGAPRSGVRDFLETSRAVVSELDEKGRIIFVSPTVTDVFGYSTKDFLGNSPFDWFDDPARISALEQFLATMRAGITTRSVFQAQHKQGHDIWLESVTTPFQGEDGQLRTIIVTHDITQLKAAGDELRRSEDRYRAIAENASDLIAEIDEEGRILFISANCEAIVGHTAEALMGQTLWEIGGSVYIHPDDQRPIAAALDGGIPTDGEGRELEFRYRHHDGSWRSLHAKGQAYRRGDTPLRIVVVARDVTEKAQAQQEVRDSEERYRVLAEASQDMISEMDAEGRLIYHSPTLFDVLGYRPDEVAGTTPFGLVHPEDIERVTDGFLAGMEAIGPRKIPPYRVRHRDGSWRWVEGSGVAYRAGGGEMRFVAVTRDVTESRRAAQQRQELEERMQRAQKLESLGVLAGGVAHDFNNLLTPILGDASLALLEASSSSPMRTHLRRIQKAAQRAAALTNQMLAYAGAGPLVSEPVDISSLVAEMSQLLETAVSRETVLESDLAPDLPRVMGDGAQLSQVVMNLITNAAEALEPGTGQISLRTGQVDLDESTRYQAGSAEEVPEGTYVYFEVTDSGCGMSPETRSKIFDPFFTTKFTGRGLGLAAVLGIVRGHHGTIEIDSELGRGTRIRVLLPSCESSASAEAAQDLTALEWRTGGTALVIDDDDGVRVLAETTLRRAGLTVLGTADGREGIEIFRKHSEEIRIVVLDRTMPSISGEEVFDGIRSVRSDARVILMSGYSEKRAASYFVGKSLSGFLQKPFLPEVLLHKVRQTLEA